MKFENPKCKYGFVTDGQAEHGDILSFMGFRSNRVTKLDSHMMLRTDPNFRIKFSTLNSNSKLLD